MSDNRFDLLHAVLFEALETAHRKHLVTLTELHLLEDWWSDKIDDLEYDYAKEGTS